MRLNEFSSPHFIGLTIPPPNWKAVAKRFFAPSVRYMSDSAVDDSREHLGWFYLILSQLTEDEYIEYHQNESDVAGYVTLLRIHDWQYQFSDDQQVWKKGNNERQRLEALQRKLDPDQSIWNQFKR
jgi:rubrerythrin